MAGFVLGVLVTLSSVGAGAIGMTALVLLYPRTPIAKLVGSDIAHAVPLTLIAGIGHWLLGSVNWLLLSSLLIGSLPGVYIGSHFAARLPDRILRPLLARDFVAGGHKDVAFGRIGGPELTCPLALYAASSLLASRSRR